MQCHQISFPVGGTDGQPAGGTLAVVQWEGRPGPVSLNFLAETKRSPGPYLSKNILTTTKSSPYGLFGSSTFTVQGILIIDNCVYSRD